MPGFLVAVVLVLAFSLCTQGHTDVGDEYAIVNSGYEDSDSTLVGWSSSVWTNVGSGSAHVATRPSCHSGNNAANLTIPSGATNWAFSSTTKINVTVGQLLSLSAWVFVSGSGNVGISAVGYDSGGTVLDWNLGLQAFQYETTQWVQLGATIWIATESVSYIIPRAVGSAGGATVYLDDWLLEDAPSTSFTFKIGDFPTWRDLHLWPFTSGSIWNLPIGEDATYVPANLDVASTTYIEADPDVILLDSSNPMTEFLYCSAGWSGYSRCAPNTPETVLLTAPFPATFIVPDCMNNYGTALLMPDNDTIKQTQPIAHCSEEEPVTTGYTFADVSITGEGITGAHGGSGLSAIGGTVRLGEFIPDDEGVIWSVRHALKSNLFAKLNYYRVGSDRSTCYRWPATGCDGYFDEGDLAYGGTNPSVRPGSLLAIPQSVDIYSMPLYTAMGLALAWTLQNYGLYLVDDSAWDALAIETELQPEGDYEEEFQESTGFAFHGNSDNSPWQADVLLIWQSLYVVDNWDYNLYSVVTASNGTLGSGGGEPLQPWAPTDYSHPSSSGSPSHKNHLHFSLLLSFLLFILFFGIL